MAMVRFAPFLLGAVSSGVGAFQVPLSGVSTAVICCAKFDEQRTRCALRPAFGEGSPLRLSSSPSDDDAGLAAGLASLDADLAAEIDAALSLAQDALAGAADDADIDEIAALLTGPPPAYPAPPQEEPPAAVVSRGLSEGAGEDAPLPPASPLPVVVDFGETVQNNIDRWKNSLFGLADELETTEAVAEEAEDTTAALKKDIAESIAERKAMLQRIESEFASENEVLATQMGIASEELRIVMDQSAHNITAEKSKATRAERELISRIASLNTAIDEAKASASAVTREKERIQRSRQSIVEKAVLEGKKKLGRFTKSLEFDVNYATRRNAELARRAGEAEGKVRGVYDRISDMRTEKESLQQQIVDVEKEALEAMEILQRELTSDESRYNTALSEECSRMDGVIDDRYKSYAIQVCQKMAERHSVKADYREQLRTMNSKASVAKEKDKARVQEYLDKLEERHKKERIVVYQEKIEAVSAIRKQMNAELAIEYGKIEDTHTTMRVKIEAVNEQTARLKADFEEEMAQKRWLAQELEEDMTRKISDVREDMTDKMKTQRRCFNENREALSAEMNVKIADSELQLRRRWRELATSKQSLTTVREQRDHAQHDVTGKQSLIDAYESDRNGFRTSLRLTAKRARENIGLKTRRLLNKVRRITPR